MRRRSASLTRCLQPTSVQPAGRGGFTLVEMLVSTALVMLIMVLFAEIYAAAVGSIREQEGIAKNDQKARSVINMLRNDLKARSYREIPLAVTDPSKASLVARGIVPIHPRTLVIDSAQRGYFYISENDPADDTDDVLSLSVLLTTDVGKYAGRVKKDDGTHVNHPDSDDAVLGDGMTVSRAAVVTYFLQDGKLHRRINLLRDPLCIPNPWNPDSGALFWMPVQPSDETIGGLTQLGTGNLLYPTSDYSTWYQDNGMARLENPPSPRMRVLGIESLDNTQGHVNAPIGLPRNREGHAASGNPVEFSGANFQGRPALPGTRVGEDIVLGGVVGFDIKVWEPRDANLNGAGVTDSFEGPFRGGRFVDIGHGVLTQTNGSAETNETGPFRNTATGGMGNNSSWGKLNTAYSPGGPSGFGVFDTWHPLAADGTTPPVPPTALPATAIPPYFPLKVPSDATAATSNWTATSAVTADGTDWTQSTVFFPWGYLGDFSIGYRCVTSGSTGSLQPVWSRILGNKIQDGSAVWECFDNRIGLTGMRITVRFMDPGSNLVRQVTLDHSFLD